MMKQQELFSLTGRIFLGLAYAIYGYLHFFYTTNDIKLVPALVGSQRFWVIFIGICWWLTAISFFFNRLTRISGLLASLLLLLILFFVILPQFNGMTSWLSLATILGLIGGSLGIAGSNYLWPASKQKKYE